MKRFLYVSMWMLAASSLWGQAPRKEPPKIDLSLPDQMERKQDLASHRGDVVILLFGDREGAKQNREIGEQLQVEFHPTAKGQTGAKAAQAPVTPLANLPQGKRSPDVKIIPVACIGKVPAVVKNLIRSQVKKEVGETPVWLDYEDRMKELFGLSVGEPNLAVIDAEGKLRFRATGKLDEKNYARVVEVTELLRKEAAGVK